LLLGDVEDFFNEDLDEEDEEEDLDLLLVSEICLKILYTLLYNDA
jgi:hypothetical protein